MSSKKGKEYSIEGRITEHPEEGMARMTYNEDELSKCLSKMSLSVGDRVKITLTKIEES